MSASVGGAIKYQLPADALVALKRNITITAPKRIDSSFTNLFPLADSSFLATDFIRCTDYE
jgi:hypothetical protein